MRTVHPTPETAALANKIKKQFARNVHRLLRERGMTPTDLATRMGYAKNLANIHAAIHGREAIGMDMLAKYAHALCVEPSELITFEKAVLHEGRGNHTDAERGMDSAVHDERGGEVVRRAGHCAARMS